MAVVYILYSHSLDRYYIGSCLNLSKRISDHKAKIYEDSYTRRAEDWELYYKIEDLEYTQARKIEAHIKRMKSKKYINDLSSYPEIREWLIRRYE